MIIDPTLARRFIKHYQDFLASIVDPEESQGKQVFQIMHLARCRFAADRSLFATWRAQNTHRDGPILDAIESLQIKRWIYLKDTRSYSVFLSPDTDSAYAVYGLTQRLRDITGYSGLSIETGICRIGTQYLCDGILGQTVQLGPGYLKSFRATYGTLRRDGLFYLTPQDEALSATLGADGKT
jgi:hypothetical protein